MLFACSAPSPQLQARKTQCSDENNAYTVGERIGNSGYWNCLDRLETAQKRQEKLLNEKNYLRSLQDRCEAFGFKKDTMEFSNCLMNQKKQDDDNAYRENVLREQAAERQRKALRDFNDALKPQWIPEVTIEK